MEVRRSDSPCTFSDCMLETDNVVFEDTFQTMYLALQPGPDFDFVKEQLS